METVKELQEKYKLLNKTKSILLDPEVCKVNEMAQEYEEALGNYQFKPTLNYLKNGLIKKEDKNFKVWFRAVSIADQLDLPYKFFVQAQFWVFNNWAARPPKVYELSGVKTKVNCIERVKLYIAAIKSGKAQDKITYGKVLPKEILDQDYINALCMKQMQALKKMHKLNTEEEVFIKLGKLSEILFDKNWIENNQVYIKLKSENKI